MTSRQQRTAVILMVGSLGLVDTLHADTGDIVAAVVAAFDSLTSFLGVMAREGALQEQATAQNAIRDLITEIAFPAPTSEKRPGVLRPVPIVMGEVRSMATEVGELANDWRFTGRTRPIDRARRTQDRIDRLDIEALFGVAAGSNPERQQLHQFVGVLAEHLVASRLPAAGQWATTLPIVEAESAVGSRRTPGDALRDAAWFAANAGRVAQNNSDLMTHRLTLSTLEFGEIASYDRLSEAAGKAVYGALACQSRDCRRGSR